MRVSGLSAWAGSWSRTSRSTTASSTPISASCMRGTSELDDAPEDLTALHLVERLLHLVQRDRLRDELVERQPALEVEVDEQWEVPAGEAVAVPARLDAAAPTEQLDERQLDLHVRRRHAHLHQRAGEVAAVEGLLEDRGVAHRLDAHVGA